jgi:long-chain-fatty-acid--CoA ligase ACSBG
VLIIGDERKYLTCLITLKCRIDYQSRGGKPTDELSPEVIGLIQGLGIRGKTILQEVKDEPEVLSFIQKCFDQVNSRAVSRVTQVKKWKILDRDFSIDGGELTPTLKVKRKVVAKLHSEAIEQLYQEPKL